MSRLLRHRYLIARRILQAGILVLLAGGNLYGWPVLVGDLSHSRLLGTVPFSDPFAVAQLLVAGGVLAGDVLLGAVLVLAFYALVGGRTFCAWVCPLNAVTDLANRLGTGRRGTHPRTGRAVRYWVLGLALVVSAVAGTAAFEAVSPIGMLHRGVIFGMGAGWAAVAAVFLFDLAVMHNGFCGRLCPLGAFYALIGRFGLLRVRHDHTVCTHCLECLRVCPENQILQQVGRVSGTINRGVCTNCGRCIEVCDDDALGFRIRGRALSERTGG